MADGEVDHLAKTKVGRRGFLKRAGAGAAAGLAIAPQTVAQRAGSAEVGGPVKPGSDFMLDVIRSLGIEYCAANPGSSFRGLHESILNYAGNKNPELLTCLHEESSAAMAHGYAKIEGRPMMIMVSSTLLWRSTTPTVTACPFSLLPATS
jgi:hypothetical protein